MSPQSPHRRRGMTLLEVVLAVTIFSIMAVGFLKVLDRIAGFTTLVERETLLRNKIYNSLEMMRTNALSLTIGTETMPADEDGIVVERVIEIFELKNQDLTLPGFYRVKFTATPPDGDQSKSLSVETYVYQP